jgi:hypothetical protein
MEVPQGNSLCSYFKQAKLSFLFFLFVAKLENRRAEQACLGVLDLLSWGSKWGKGIKG